MVSIYEQYLALRRQCGYDEHGAMIAAVWNGCDPVAQENMLDQLRAGAEQRENALARFGGDHW